MAMNPEGYPVFKGLQKPLEFMGIRGRFLTLAAAAVGVSFVGFIVFSKRKDKGVFVYKSLRKKS